MAKYWVEAFKTAAYVRKRIKIEGINNGMSPYEATTGKSLFWGTRKIKKPAASWAYQIETFLLPDLSLLWNQMATRKKQ